MANNEDKFAPENLDYREVKSDRAGSDAQKELQNDFMALAKKHKAEQAIFMMQLPTGEAGQTRTAAVVMGDPIGLGELICNAMDKHEMLEDFFINGVEVYKIVKGKK